MLKNEPKFTDFDRGYPIKKLMPKEGWCKWHLDLSAREGYRSVAKYGNK